MAVLALPNQQQTDDQPQQLSVGQGSTPTAAPQTLDVGPTGTTDSSPDTIDSRATKVKYGLGDLLGKTRDEIYQNLQDGQEDQLRQDAASTIDDRKRQATEELLAKTAAAKQGPLTPEERDGLVEIVQNLQKNTDPATVFETAYGRQFVSQLDRVAQGNPDDNILSTANQIDPEGVAKIMQAHSTLAAKTEIINTALENANDRAKAQGWVGWGWDLAKSQIPGYEDIELRGNVPGVNILSGLLGSNLEEQRKVLLRMQPDELKRKLDDIGQNLTPSMNVEFLQAMKGLSSDAETAHNLSLPLQSVGFAEGVIGAKIVKKALMGDVARAAEDMSVAAGQPGVSKSTIEAAAGDLSESAVTRATTNTTADIQNVPMATRRAIEANVSTFRADLEAARANPGTRGQDIVNRIAEQSDQITNQLITTALNIQKNERLPDVLSNESAVRLIVEDMKNKYRDLTNSIIDTSGIYKEPLSNTYLMDFIVGKNDGTYFPNRDVAQNFINYHGLGGASVEEGTNAAFTPDNVAIKKATDNITSAQKIIDREQSKLQVAGISEKDAAKSNEQISLAREYIVDQAMNRIAAQKNQATVEQQGLGYYVKLTKPIDETAPAIRQAIAQTANTKIPDSPVSNFINSWIGKLRTPEEVLSLAERQNRLTSTYAPNNYFKIMVDNAKDIKSLQSGRFSKGRKRWVEWQQGLKNAQELPDPLDPDRKGYFFQSPGEMEQYWQQWFHRLPDEQEIGAYFEFKRGMEIDRVFRNFAEHRNRSRVGAETHNLIATDAAGKEYKSPDFDGVIRNKLPGAADNMAIMGNKLGEERVVALDRQSTKAKADLQKDIDRGLYKLVELYNPEQRPLSGFGNITDERIRYVLSPQVETRPLDWNHVPRRGGGHIDYDYDFYIKQAKVRADDVGGRHWYEGDTTIMASPTHGIGSKVAEHLNQIRQHLKNKDVEAAKAYSNEHMHVDWNTVKSWFIAQKDENGKLQLPRLALDQDIRVVPRNKQIIDIDNELPKKYADFRNGMREGSLARQAQVEFNQERDAFELLGVNVEGTKANPLYKVAPADKVDAVTTMNRGFMRIARSNFMDDYKTMAIEHWLQQAQNYLKVDNDEVGRIWSAPHYYFNQGTFKSSAPAELVQRLEASRYHTQQLTGQPSTTDALLHSAAQKLSDMAFNRFGPKGLVITPTWLLPKMRDPFGFARSIAFNVKLGLFNIPQFIVQAGNYANIFGIAGGRFATPGTLGAQLHFWSTVNSHPAILNYLDNIASKMAIPGTARWKPGEFTEAFNELHKTGFGHVGGEVATLDRMGSKVIQTPAGRFLDWGRYPFKAGEENARYGAWYTAFKEFRDANPTGRITNEDRAKILQRADLLNVNMSRASSSAIHKGVWSIPTQFYTYQIRLTELMFGNRLSKTEKTRLFLTNAALFGLPMAAGTTAIPAADYLRRTALDYNYVVGNDFWHSMIMEGLPSAIGAIISGGGDPHKGTWYDVGPRFGTKGLEFLGTATSGQDNKGWLDMLGGPVYSIAKDTITQSDGLASLAMSFIHDGDPDDPIKMDVNDVADIFKEITSVNSAWRVYAAIQFGRWVSKKDAYLADTSPAQALISAAFGVKDVTIDDINLKTSSLNVQKEYDKYIEDQFKQEFRRGVLAQKGDDPDGAKNYFTRAKRLLAISGYREDQINGLVSRALSDNQSVMDKVNWDYYIRKAQDANREGALKAFQDTSNIQEQKQGNGPVQPNNPTH